MFGMLVQPGAALSPETRQAIIKSSVRYVAEELQAMPGVLAEMPADQRAKLSDALAAAVYELDAFEDERAARAEFAEAVRTGAVPL